jgi:hypothetical protein
MQAGYEFVRSSSKWWRGQGCIDGGWQWQASRERSSGWRSDRAGGNSHRLELGAGARCSSRDDGPSGQLRREQRGRWWRSPMSRGGRARAEQRWKRGGVVVRGGKMECGSSGDAHVRGQGRATRGGWRLPATAGSAMLSTVSVITAWWLAPWWVAWVWLPGWGDKSKWAVNKWAQPDLNIFPNIQTKQKRMEANTSVQYIWVRTKRGCFLLAL